MSSSDGCSNSSKQITELKEQLRQSVQEKEELKKELDSSKQEISYLQMQITTYHEDFESERRDRERAQSRIADLEMELNIVKRELHQHNLRQMQDLQQRRQAALEFHRKEYERTHPNASVYACDGHRSVNGEEGEDEIDCM